MSHKFVFQHYGLLLVLADIHKAFALHQVLLFVDSRFFSDIQALKMAEAVPEEELTIPRAAMNKMIKEIVPSVRVANEARELILNCCSEFIHLLASEANEICTQQQKKTINAEHILGGNCYKCCKVMERKNNLTHIVVALDRLGFNDYRTDAEAVLKDCKAVAAKRRRQSTRLENLGIPEEELLRQ
jgi:histone H3/H4